MEPLTKNQTHIARITGYTSSGYGVCRINGRAVFVPFALPDELWEILILKVTSAAVYGKGAHLIEPSPERQEPPCPAFGKCGGCSLLHMSYAEELSFKLSRVNDAMERIAGLTIRADEIRPAAARERYRNKVIFNFSADAEGRTSCGFYRERSHELTPITDCLLAPELAIRAAKALCAFMDAERLPLYDERTRKGTLRHLFVRRATRKSGAVAVVVSARGFGAKTEKLVCALRQAAPELTGILLCVNKTEGNVVLTGQYHTLWGEPDLTDELCGLTFRFSPDSFYQINPPQAEKLYEKASLFAEVSGKTALDLYCGVGTLTLALAKTAKQVYGVEIVGPAARCARENARLNNLTNAEFLTGDADAAARELERRGIKPDAVVVDPPRKGLTPELIGTIARLNPARVVYVSCDPGTLARDAKALSALGFHPTRLTAVDMFPATAHIECVMLLERTSSNL
ncbi:MAG: 23S rRNA (uracil(1939)-C(5))-methyltransferase RlmD [Oscillospiraceae bacterium]|nr:23S rRNA (uracil(1939)-C(5))-methyltransferase RlmD [Oscillospiraceae bacterium]